VRTIKLTIAYDGTAYAGWQYQPDRMSVQETLENALNKVTGERIRVLASGRTDAGVHALGQVVGFRTECKLPPDALLRAINANLPPDVAALDAAEVPDGFHPISHARRKRYRYVIHDGPVRDVFSRNHAWHYRYGRLDAEAMDRAAAALLGTHDFSSFESAGAPRESSVRTIFAIGVERCRAGQGRGLGDGDGGTGDEGEGLEDGGEGLGIRRCGNAGMRECGKWKRPATAIAGDMETPRDCDRGGTSQASIVAQPCAEKGGNPQSDFIIIEVEADGFLYNMVRAIVGTLVEVGRGKRPVSWPGEVLRAADRRAAGPTAPPQGLFLVNVEY